MEFNIAALEKIVKDIQKPSVIIFCPPSIINDLKERWNKNITNVEFRSLSSIDDDKIYVLPVLSVEELNKPIKVVIPEEQYELEKYLDLMFGK